MKIDRGILCGLLVILILSLRACYVQNEYVPTGGFYVKSSPYAGDAGMRDVISLEAEYSTYRGEGDITVSMCVGLGHLPGDDRYGDDANDTFYVLYEVFDGRWETDKTPVWAKKVEYSDSWDDEKYNSTEQKNPPTLIIPRYGEFYPVYKENVDIVFPADVKSGYLSIKIYTVLEGRNDYTFMGLDVSFTRADGVLTLDPN